MSSPRSGQRLRWRITILVLVPLLLAGMTAAYALWRSVVRRSEEALRRVPSSVVRYPLRAAPALTLGAAGPREGLGVLTAPAEARDGLDLEREEAGGATTLIATSGGLLLYRGGDPAAPRLFTHLDGLSSVSLRAAAALSAGRVVLGDASGGLTVLQRERATTLHIEGPGSGPIIDLLAVGGSSGEVLYILQQDAGLLAWSPGSEEVVDIGRSTGVDLRGATALCYSSSGGGGLVVGTADGHLLRERGGKLVPAGTVPLRVTALSCTGPRIYAGTPLGLYATPRGGESAAPLTLLRADLFVTSLLDNGLDQGAPGAVGSLVVATFDDGVLRFEVSGARLRQVDHQIAQQRVLRLRSAGSGSNAARIETVLALGVSHAYRLAPGIADPRPLAGAAAALAGPHVTALAQDGRGRLWTGTFEHGIDLLDLRQLAALGQPARALLGHRPQPSEPGGDNINALLYRARSDEVLAATVRGIDVYGPEQVSPRRLGPPEGLIGDQVQALADLGSGAALAAGTSRGLTLFGADAGAHSLYAFHGLAANRVYSLLWQAPRLYVGTLAGVSVVEGDRVRRSYTPASAPGLRAGWISALAACDGAIFIGTYGGGVAVLAGDAPLTPLAALQRLHVNPGALLCEGGQLYIGTLEAGLWRLDPRTRAAARLDAALLPAASVTALAVAHPPAGPALFMIGTEAGLLWLTPARLSSALRRIGDPS